MRFGELVVDLQGTAELQHGFLKLFVFQKRLATGDVVGFGFFRRGARAKDKDGGEQGKKQRKDVELAAALSIFHCGLRESRQVGTRQFTQRLSLRQRTMSREGRLSY